MFGYNLVDACDPFCNDQIFLLLTGVPDERKKNSVYFKMRNLRQQQQKFCKTKDLGFPEDKAIAFQRSKFHTSKCARANENKQSEQSIMTCSSESVKSISRLQNCFVLIRSVSFVAQNSPMPGQRGLCLFM